MKKDGLRVKTEGILAQRHLFFLARYSLSSPYMQVAGWVLTSLQYDLSVAPDQGIAGAPIKS